MRGVERMNGSPRGGSSRLRRWSLVAVAAVLAATVGCGQSCAGFNGRVQVETPAPAAVQPEPAAVQLEPAAPAPIGVATMLEDGTIVMTLTAVSAGGARGEGRFTYKPGDRNYDAVLEHLGSLVPGQSVPVLPWPDGGN